MRVAARAKGGKLTEAQNATWFSGAIYARWQSTGIDAKTEANWGRQSCRQAGFQPAETNFSGFVARSLRDAKLEKIRANCVSGLFRFDLGLKGRLQARLPQCHLVFPIPPFLHHWWGGRPRRQPAPWPARRSWQAPDSSRKERNEGVPRRPGDPPHYLCRSSFSKTKCRWAKARPTVKP
jgi:hypothetical protein